MRTYLSKLISVTISYFDSTKSVKTLTFQYYVAQCLASSNNTLFQSEAYLITFFGSLDSIAWVKVSG